MRMMDGDGGGGFFRGSGRLAQRFLSGNAGSAGLSPTTGITGVTGPPGNVNYKGGGGGMRLMGVLHDGGKVPEDGVYALKADEMVLPAKDKSKKGRDSEYRRLYLKRTKKG